MRILADTNIWLRIADENSQQHSIAEKAIEALLASGEEIFLAPQNVVEFWAVATRPIEANGLGWSTENTAAHLKRLQDEFEVLAESAEILPAWWELVSTNRVAGRKVHDTRLAAQMVVHRLSHILTFNGQDFVCYEGIAILSPSDVISTHDPNNEN